MIDDKLARMLIRSHRVKGDIRAYLFSHSRFMFLYCVICSIPFSDYCRYSDNLMQRVWNY